MAFSFSQKRDLKDVINFIVIVALSFILIFILGHFFLANRGRKGLPELKIYKKVNVDFSIFDNEKFKRMKALQEVVISSDSYSSGRENPFVSQTKKK